MHRRRIAPWAALAAALGCAEGTTPPAPADPDLARQVLTMTLDAWKDGKSPADLARQSPAIQVADDDWTAGAKLLEYQAEDDVRPTGVSVRCPVTLAVRDRRGKTVKKRVLYQVNTHPLPSVIRHDDL